MIAGSFKSRHIIGLFSLILMLELLHLSLWIDFGQALSRAMILVHFGLFLIWQPVWRGDESISLMNSGLFILLTLVFVAWLNLWFMFFWIILLIGFLGGFIKHNTSDQIIYMVTLAFLVTELLMGATTQIFNINVGPVAHNLFFYGLFALPLILLFFIRRKTTVTRENVDLLRAVSSALLISLVALGSLLNMYHTGTTYLDALIKTILAISFLLLVISWLLSPRFGFSGLSQVWSQSLLNIGTPFEQWLNKISNLNQELTDPDEFLDASMRELMSISWISGLEWNIGVHQGRYGKEDKYQVSIKVKQLTVTLYTRLVVGGTLYLHCNLLIKIIENLYTSKIKERELNDQIHLQSIYETGARITHDIKNLLQSLKTLTSIVGGDESIDSNKQALLKTQLPHLTQRLQLALDKLQSPRDVQQQDLDIKSWSQSLENRLKPNDIKIMTDIRVNHEIPGDLFDSVIDNLLENIANKKQLEAEITVKIEIHTDENNVRIAVSDTGTAIPEDKARRLLTRAVTSENGLGIGIYQSSRHAELHGYRLKLKENMDGNVCFELSKS
jgi:signal transduction histidine kinase